jgi:hypothetical protein
VLAEGHGWFLRRFDRTRALQFVSFIEELRPLRIVPVGAEEHAGGVHVLRAGELLVFDEGSLRFSWRSGRWQYWNHSHLISLLHSAARVQHVNAGIVKDVLRGLYYATLDVSFRRTGGLFVVLRRVGSLHRVVAMGDAVDDARRLPHDQEFDEIWRDSHVQDTTRILLAELASLDGALVFSNSGRLLAYGAIISSIQHRRSRDAEGSRTKAAISASRYGLALKVSSDGQISAYVNGRRLFAIGE